MGNLLSRYLWTEDPPGFDGPTPTVDELLRSGQPGLPVRCIAAVEDGAVRFPAEIRVFSSAPQQSEAWARAESAAATSGTVPDESEPAGSVAAVVAMRDSSDSFRAAKSQSAPIPFVERSDDGIVRVTGEYSPRPVSDTGSLIPGGNSVEWLRRLRGNPCPQPEYSS